jgi:hypothetical protein
MPAVHKFDEAALLVALQAGTLATQSAFAQACAHRIHRLDLPSLPDEVRLLCDRSLEAARQFIEGEAFDATALVSLREAVESSEDVDDDRVAACAFVLRHLVSREVQEAVCSARRAYDACDALAQRAFDFDVFTREVEDSLLAHPIVQAELRKQHLDLQQLRSDPGSSTLVLARAKRRDT